MKVVRLSMAVIVLFYLAKIALPTPLAPVKQGVVLNEFIRHSEPAIYDPEPLKQQRHRYKRSTEEMTPPLKINLTALNREFHLVLRQDHNIFAEEAVFEDTSGRRLQFDPGKAYTGTLQDDDSALVQGIITEDGLFDGTISTPLDDYYIEPVRRYLSPGAAPPVGYHSIIYRSSDVTHPVTTNCASEQLARKQPKELKRDDVHLDETRDRNKKPHRSRIRRWFPFDFLEPTTDISVRTRPNNRHTVNSPTTVYHFENQSHDVHILTNSVSKMHEVIRTDVKASTQATIITRPKLAEDSNKYPKTNHYNPPNERTVPKILIGIGASDDTNIIFDDDFNSRQHIHKRATIDPKKTTCMLYLQADHLFFQKYGTEEACIEVMTRHVQRVNAIYRATDFNQDGKSDNISFMIKRVKVHSSEALQDPTYRFPGNYGVEKFLELFSEEDYDAFCLAYMFTYRDFEMGTLGLAWTGDLKNAGGVCEKNGHYRGSMKSLNTGIVTLLNYGKHVPPAVSHVTLAHEIGHNFGSPHDPEICTPGGEDGNFIMFARATSGDKKNNNQFSPCSLNSINPVLNAKARSPKGCFTEPQSAICGNGVVEVGEQCDCGWEEDCRDSCCYPQRRYPPTDEPPCRLTPKSMCSPSQGPCCTSECQLKFGDKCRDDNGCRDSSFCDGRGPHCPPSINKPNKTVCNDEFVCFMGECTGSICLAYGLESCQCIPEPHEPPTKACELCCKLPGENQPCLSSFSWNSVPYDIPDMFSKPGTPCNDYNGYCDVFQKCREVDPSGPLATLRKLLLSEESIASFKRWIMDRWYYASLIVVLIIFILVLSTRMFGKSTNLKLKAVTIIHSSTTETVRLPPETDGANVVVHPAAVRSKLPLKRRVHEVSRRHRSKDPVVKKVKKSEQTKRSNDNPEDPVASSPKKVQKKNPPLRDKKKKPVKGKKKKEIIDYSAAQEKTSGKTPEDDPLGKVRNWLLNSHNITGSLAVRKSKSSPAGFTSAEQAPPRSPVKTHKKSDQRGKSGSLDAGAKDPHVKLQVMYKPPFKFSVKLRKPTELATHVVKEINSRVSQKPRTALVMRANDRGERKRNQAKRKSRPVSGEVKKVNSSVPQVSTETKVDNDVQKTTVFESENKEKEPIVVPPEVNADREETPLVPVEQVEPVYQNTGNLRCTTDREESVVEEEVKPCLKPDRSIDLLRMTSVECKTQSQLPIAPEVCKQSKTRNLSRHHSETRNHNPEKLKEDGKKRTRRDTSRESRKRHSYSEKCADLIRFPSVEMNNPLNKSEHVKASTSCDIPKRLSVPHITSLVDSDLDSNLHTVPSDLEVLLSESEYLFSDA